MKVTFEGAPDVVIREMQEYIARWSLQLEDQDDRPRAESKISNVEISEPPGQIVATPVPEVTDQSPLAQDGQGQEPLLTSEECACRFCGRYTGKGGRLAKHERHCKQNPNRTPDPREGRPINPGLKAYLDQKRA